MNSIILAQAAQQAQGGGWDMLITIGLFFVIIYFIAIRPQRKQQKELKERQDALKIGDEVITNSGIYGTVRAVKDDIIKLEIANGTIIRIAKVCIAQMQSTEAPAEKK